MNGSQESTEEDDKLPYIPSKLTCSEKQKLEVLRMKESTLKSSSTIIVLLSKWFKASHILKYEYFLSLLFDSNFITQSFRLLNSNKIHSRWSHSYDFKDPDSLMKNRLIYCDYEALYQLNDYNFLFEGFKSLLRSKNSKYYRDRREGYL
ncbi:transmembrane hyphal anastomosis protein ham2 far11 [Brettanomyces bruxellensis AWRI1499]|nr:transmembrane hyphal anastomosis protein ham2 far11 [Brettanomyces bruxellensis AWRI1499]